MAQSCSRVYSEHVPVLIGSLTVLGPDFTKEIKKSVFLFDNSIYTTVTPYLVAGICGPNKKDYGGVALDIEIWSNDNSESIKHRDTRLRDSDTSPAPHS